MGVDSRDQRFQGGMRQAGAAILLAISAHEVSGREAATTDAMTIAYADRMAEMVQRAAASYLQHRNDPDVIAKTMGFVTQQWAEMLCEPIAVGVGLLGMLQEMTGRPLEEIIDAATKMGDN